jgi:hypothetical protein
MSTARAFSGETYTTRATVATSAPASCARYRASMATRNPASVLPDPVGAATSVSRPDAINGQPATCGSVGPSGNRRANHPATAGWNRSSPAGRARSAMSNGRVA